MTNTYDEVRKGIIYLAVDRENGQSYIGSSACSLATLEYNHRHWLQKNYSATEFRRYLSLHEDQVEFSLAEEITGTRALLELIEQEWIQRHNPTLNNDDAPFEMSCRRDRIDPELREATIAEYVALNRKHQLEVV